MRGSSTLTIQPEGSTGHARSQILAACSRANVGAAPVALAILLTTLAAPARAETIEEKAAACAACHGPVGQGNPLAGYPALRAQHSVYVVKQLNAYSGDVRYAKDEHGVSYGGDNATIMRTIAARLTDEDMRNVASYIQGIR